MRRPWITMTVVLALATSSVWAGFEAEQMQKLLAGDGASDDRFGFSVSMDGHTAIIGATGVWSDGMRPGAAYVFVQRDGSWVQQAKLLPDDVSSGSSFGFSVDIDEDTAVVGRMGDSAGGSAAGAAYVFVRQNGAWTQQAKLRAIDGAAHDWFGWSVGVAGDTVVVGAIGDDGPGGIGNYTGSVYVFTRRGEVWTQQSKLRGELGGEQFGMSVAIDGDTVAVGADNPRYEPSYPYGCGCFIGRGSAYVFTRQAGAWLRQGRLTPAYQTRGNFFGRSVAVHRDTIAVGSPGFTDNGEHSGAAYVFARQGVTWTQQAKLLAADGRPRISFGLSVALEEDTVIVGASGDEHGPGSGSAYVFTREDGVWTEQTKMLPEDGASADQFGRRIALESRTALIGAAWDDDRGENSGSAYVFDLGCRIDAALDVRPDSVDNPINPRSAGVVPVVLLGSDDLDVTTVDANTLRFGRDGASLAHSDWHLSDVNLDGFPDLVQHYRVRETGIACGDEQATLIGETLDGCEIEGSDAIRTVGNCH